MAKDIIGCNPTHQLLLWKNNLFYWLQNKILNAIIVLKQTTNPIFFFLFFKACYCSNSVMMDIDTSARTVCLNCRTLQLLSRIVYQNVIPAVETNTWLNKSYNNITI